MADEATSGLASAVAVAIEEAGPLLPLRDAEQLELLRDPRGRLGQLAAEAAPRGVGRPKGARNRRTEAWRDYLVSRYAHPLEVLAQAISRPIDAIVAETGCKPIEALAVQMRAAAELAPYLESKMPVAVEARLRADVVLLMPGLNAPAASLGELADLVGREGVDAIDWAGAQVIEGEANSEGGA